MPFVPSLLRAHAPGATPRSSRGPASLLLALLALLALLVAPAAARNGADALNHYGLITLTDADIGDRLAGRFKAKGQPVFLVHDVSAGLSQNDIMRFADRAVLIDADVWSTLQAEGALAKLKASPVIRVQGRATSATWAERADLVAGDRQKKTFKLGAEILRVLEENFGGAPLENQMTLVFERGNLTLLAASGLVDQMRFFPVRRVQSAGNPFIVSMPPDSNQFTGKPFEFQVWGADPADPSGDLSYDLLGTPPPGLAWDAARHALRGTPTTPGRWALTAQVRNASGLRDTMRFVLRLRANQPPLVAIPPRNTVLTGREWHYAPLLADADHPGYALRVRPDTLPRGMTWRADSGAFTWRPDSSLANTRHTFVFSVEDALGGRRTYRHDLRVLSDEGILLSEGVKIEMPWDTLMRGRGYIWRTGAIRAAWAAQNIRLGRIEGPDSTRYSGDTLYLRPMASGVHQLDFHFDVLGLPVVQTVMLPVQDDSPPVFVTELTGWKLRASDPPRQYRPVAVDPEGERVSITAQLPPGSPLRWDGKRLHFAPSRPGVYPARFVARDAGGKQVEQWVAFDTEKEMAGSSWMIENRMEGSYTAWTLTRDFGTGRLGIYTPNLTDGYKPESYWLKKETPFFFIGGNVMGRAAEARSQTLWTDIGFNIGMPDNGLVKAGMYTRLNGEWNFANSPLSWVEFEIAAHAHQAVAATDSGTIAILFKDTTDIRSRDSLGRGPLTRTMRDAYRDDNIRIYSRLEALGPLGLGFFAGPTLWRQDMPMAQRHVQWMGGALRYRLEAFSDVYQVTGRLGWSPGGEGWAWYTSVRVAFGAPL